MVNTKKTFLGKFEYMRTILGNRITQEGFVKEVEKKM